jgi:hypothetical protein
MNIDEFFAERERRTSERVEGFRASLVTHLQADGGRLFVEDACAYAVGSAGRGEMSKSSDLDLFLVTLAESKRLNEILAQAAVLRMMADSGLPVPSNDATFLRLHTADSLAHRLGDVQDDPSNTFTVRMLLLLESRVLYGQPAYDRLLERVMDAYWRNEAGHKSDYLPLVLVNDIVRYWRVLLLNYEAKFDRKERELRQSNKLDGDMTVRLKNDKRFASVKLRFSRCMTCYSMIARLLSEATGCGSEKAHVSRDAMLSMIRSTPVARLQQVRRRAGLAGNDQAVACVDELLGLYREYLELREQDDAEVTAILASGDGKVTFEKAEQFGLKMFELLQELGRSSPLYRYVVA